MDVEVCSENIRLLSAKAIKRSSKMFCLRTIFGEMQDR